MEIEIWKNINEKGSLCLHWKKGEIKNVLHVMLCYIFVGSSVETLSLLCFVNFIVIQSSQQLNKNISFYSI